MSDVSLSSRCSVARKQESIAYAIVAIHDLSLNTTTDQEPFAKRWRVTSDSLYDVKMKVFITKSPAASFPCEQWRFRSSHLILNRRNARGFPTAESLRRRYNRVCVPPLRAN